MAQSRRSLLRLRVLVINTRPWLFIIPSGVFHGSVNILLMSYVCRQTATAVTV